MRSRGGNLCGRLCSERLGGKWRCIFHRASYRQRPKFLPVTDPDRDAPDGAVVDGYERRGDRWVRVDSEGTGP
jgi:hypothetical protein